MKCFVTKDFLIHEFFCAMFLIFVFKRVVVQKYLIFRAVAVEAKKKFVIKIKIEILKNVQHDEFNLCFDNVDKKFVFA